MLIFLQDYLRWMAAVLVCSCLFPYAGMSQSRDTARRGFVPPIDIFGGLTIPSDLLEHDPNHFNSIAMPQHNKLMLYKALELPSPEKPFGRPDKPILNISFYNPRTDLPPAAYAALLVGGFFNNQVLPIPKEQELKIMNDIYRRRDLNVSGFKEVTPVLPRANRVDP